MSNIVAIEPLKTYRDDTIRVEWSISKKCNFNCSYCTEFVHDKTSTFPELSVMKNVIDNIARSTNKKIYLDFLPLPFFIEEKNSSFVL